MVVEIRFWLVFMLIIIFSGISNELPAQSDIKKIKKELKEALTELEIHDLTIRGYDRKKYIIKKKILQDELKMHEKEFDKYSKLRKNKIYGPYYEWDSTMYFLQRIESEKINFYRFYYMNVEQPFGMSDSSFQKELDQLVHICEKKKIPIIEIKKDYMPDARIGINTPAQSSWSREKHLTPEVIEFMKNSRVNATFQTRKIEFGEYSYLTLIQKSDKKRKVKTISYLKIKIRKPK